jgi:HlyD family secretion protein
MTLLIIVVAIVTLAICIQVYRRIDSRTNGTLINAIMIITATIVALSLLDLSTASTMAQDSTANIPILDLTLIQPDAVNSTVNATGSIVPNRDVSLSFQYSSPVTEILVDVGDIVAAGQVLARLDADDVQQNFEIAVFNAENQQISFDQLVGQPRDVDLAAAEAALQAAQLNLGGSTVLTGEGSTQAEIQRVQLELAKNQMWQTALQRDTVLESVISSGTALDDFEPYPNVPRQGRLDLSAQLEDIQDGYNSSLANLYSIEGSLNAIDANRAFADAQYQAELARPPRYGGFGGAGLQRTQAEQQLDRLLNGPDEKDLEYSQIDLALVNLSLAQMELQLDYVELVAPFDGVITEMNLTIGEIPPAFGAVMMMDNTQFKVNLDIDEIDIMQISVGQDVEFIVDALPDDDITGVVEHVALTPNQNTQVVSYNVRVLLDETDAPIRAGMSTTGQIIITSVENALGVPDRFIYSDAVTGTSFVIVQNPKGSLQRIPVTTGARGNTLVEITGGITPSQIVVLVSSDNIEQIPYRGNTNG